jgi:hypothetical protein
MRMSRHFRPAFECMPARIAPSTTTVIGPVPPPTTPPTVTLASIGDPTTTSSGEGSFPIILAQPPGPAPAPVC